MTRESKLIRMRENWYRDLWLFLITAGLLVTAFYLVSAINEQKEGRRIGTTITCVITSAILQGSHSFIISQSTQPLPPKLEKSLEEQGYPSKVTREINAEAQADSYTASIQTAVETAVHSAKGLITVHEKESHGLRPSGAVNCAKLQTLTKVR